MDDITQVLKNYADDDTVMRGELFSILYDDLKNIAIGQMTRENAGHTLQSTALVHEAFLKLIDLRSCQWNNRHHFFVAAAEIMRRILIDHARGKKRIKRGGELKRVPIESAALESDKRRSVDSPSINMLCELEEALVELEQLAPQKAKLVKLRFFARLSLPQIAEILEISTSTADRYWAFSKAWLYQKMTCEPERP